MQGSAVRPALRQTSVHVCVAVWLHGWGAHLAEGAARGLHKVGGGLLQQRGRREVLVRRVVEGPAREEQAPHEALDLREEVLLEGPEVALCKRERRVDACTTAAVMATSAPSWRRYSSHPACNIDCNRREQASERWTPVRLTAVGAALIGHYAACSRFSGPASRVLQAMQYNGWPALVVLWQHLLYRY